MTSTLRSGNARDDLRRAAQVVWAFASVWSPIPLPRGPRAPSRAARLRVAFEWLGLTYLKLGQYLAIRFDLLDPEVCRELEQLFENVPPVPFEDVRATIEAELGAPLAELFAGFDPEPIASASVAQVHAARLPDGRKVAVKVQRPGIDRIFRSDFRNMARSARWLDRLRLVGRLSARDVAAQFVDWTERELDFVNEARTAARLRAQALDCEEVPAIDWARTSRCVITMDFVEGISVGRAMALVDEGGDDALEAAQPGIDLTLALKRFVEASLHQLFVAGFFHGDPHPGNIIVTPDNRIAFVDFGIYGEMPPWHRDKMLRMVESLAVGDFYRAYRCYADLGDATDETDVPAFKREAMELLEAWYLAQRTEGLPMAERSLGRYCMGMVTLVRRHGMSMGYETLLCWRAMISLDATLQRFWGRLDFNEEVASFFTEHAGGPLRQIERVLTDPAHAAAVWRLSRDAPRHAMSILEVASGEASLFVSETEAPAQQRGAVRQARALALCLLGVSGAIAAGGAL